MSTVHVAGIDVGSSAVKATVMRVEDDLGTVLSKNVQRIRRRDVLAVIDDVFHAALDESGVKREDLVYIASTGEGELVEFRSGHFFGMTTHSRGALHLMPSARCVLDMGALHTRAMVIDSRSRVLRSQMTSQCASGTGQFLENIARYLGIGIDEVATLSLSARSPESVSTICAVLAETDVINMVSRGVAAPDILRGIHLSMASRLVKLLRVLKAESPLALTGGLASDSGLIRVMQEGFVAARQPVEILAHPDSVYAGAIGAALWGAFRYHKLQSESAAA